MAQFWMVLAWIPKENTSLMRSDGKETLMLRTTHMRVSENRDLNANPKYPETLFQYKSPS